MSSRSGFETASMDPRLFSLVTGLVFPRGFLEVIAAPPHDFKVFSSEWLDVEFRDGAATVSPPRRLGRTFSFSHPEVFNPLNYLTPVQTPRHETGQDDRKFSKVKNISKKYDLKKQKKLVVGGKVVKYN